MAEPAQVSLSTSEIAELAGVGTSAVSNWRKRFRDFPAPSEVSSDGRDVFSLEDVEAWLKAHGKLDTSRSRERMMIEASSLIRTAAPAAQYAEILASAVVLAHVLDRNTMVKFGSASDVVARVERADPELEGMFENLTRLDRAAMQKVLELVMAIAPSERIDTFEWILGRRAHFDGVVTRGVASLLQDLSDDATSIYDPAAGEGKLLSTLNAHNAQSQLYGQESSPAAWRIAKQRSLLHDLNADLRLGNSLVSDAFANLRAEIVLCHPPHNVKNPLSPGDLADPRWTPSVVRAKLTDYAWLQHAVYHLSDEGRAYVLLPLSSLQRTGHEADIRTELLRRGEVEAVVALPPESGRKNSRRMALWVMRKARPRAEMDRVLLIDAAGPGGLTFMPGFESEFDISTLPFRIRPALSEWRESRELKYSRENAALVPVVDLVANDANLLPARWVGAPVANVEEREKQLVHAVREFSEWWQELLAAGPDLREATGIAPVRWIALRDLVETGMVEILRGARVGPADEQAGSSQSVLVLTARDLITTFDQATLSRVDTRQLKPTPSLTEAGDVVVSLTDQKILTVVEKDGGYILAHPLQAVRILSDWIDSRLAATFLKSPRNRRFASGSTAGAFDLRNLELPMFSLEDATRLSNTLRQVQRTSDVADALRDAADELYGAFISYVEAGTGGDDG